MPARLCCTNDNKTDHMNGHVYAPIVVFAARTGFVATDKCFAYVREETFCGWLKGMSSRGSLSDHDGAGVGGRGRLKAYKAPHSQSVSYYSPQQRIPFTKENNIRI